MTEKYLLIVEGAKTEKTIFGSIFEKYGFNVIKCENKISKDYKFEVIESNLVNDNKNVIIIEGPKNRIHDVLLNIISNPTDDIDNIDVETVFGYKPNDFRGIFWIYDVDHNEPDDIVTMFRKFSDENENGLLLLSSPCIEVLGDFEDRKELKVEHLSEYKKILNVFYNSKCNDNVSSFILKNINKLLLHYLEKNYNDFNDKNIMNHPSEIIDYINRFNIRDNEKHYVVYRYFSTVVYCVLAYVLGLTIEIDNYDIVKNYLKNVK